VTTGKPPFLLAEAVLPFADAALPLADPEELFEADAVLDLLDPVAEVPVVEAAVFETAAPAVRVTA
jgi:hypothetical protein